MKLHRRFHLVGVRHPDPARPGEVPPAKLPRWLFPAVIVTVLAGLIVESQAVGLLALGRVDAKEAVLRIASPSDSAHDAAAEPGAAQEQPFDYFPDHYINQGKEPAEQIDQF